MPSIHTNWKEVGFYDAFDRLKLKSYEIPTKDYHEVGMYPIIDQGDGLIAGYIDKDGPIENIPFIVFGDHTTIIKYVDQHCFIGSQGVVPLKAKECYDPYFLYLVLGRTRIPALGYSRHFRELENKTFPLPPLAEQRKIAEILRTWDEAIETAEAELTRIKKQVDSLLCSLALRLPIGNPTSGWYDSKIGDLVSEAERRVIWDDEATFRLVSCARRSGGIFHRENKLGKDIAVKKMQKVKEGDFILSRMQVLHGGWAMVSQKYDGSHVSDMYMILEAIPHKLYMPYFDWISRTSWLRHIAYLSSYGVHIEKMTFVPDLFLNSKIRIPSSVAEQKRIVSILDGFSEKAQFVEKRLQMLRTQKRGLMQKLLTGEIRVAA